MVTLGDSLIGAGGVMFCMPEEVLFKSETDQTREEIASYLRRVADKLEKGEAVTLKSGSESVTMEPPVRPTFEVKAEREGPADGPGELSIEFELEWDENGSDGSSGSGQLEIE
jgi:amphi-Trp domain-containing protein